MLSTPHHPAVPAGAAPSPGVTFTVTEGPHAGQVFRFDRHDTFIVGRSKQAHFRLPRKDEYFSRVHFLVEVNPPHCRLIDMGSTNGTFLNGRKTTVADLKDGDLIQGGQTVLRVTLENLSPEAETLQPVLTSPPPALPDPFASSPLTIAGICPVCRGAITGSLDQPVFLCPTCEASARRLPQTIPGYRLVRELGRGGMGVVYLAVQVEASRVVALKTIQPAAGGSRSEVERFLRETNILRQLDHPNIVAFRDMGEAGGRLYLVMDFVAGVDAAELIKKEGPLPVPRAVNLGCQLLDALHFAHRKGFVHRDVKPGNLLVSFDGGRETARLADFGLAKVYQASQMSGLTMMGQIGGTAAFMPPEQITQFREAQPAVDQYSAAATLYYLLTGRFIYDLPKDVPKKLLTVLLDAPVPLRSRNPNLPEGLAATIHHALAKDPDRRFESTGAFRQALPWKKVKDEPEA